MTQLQRLTEAELTEMQAAVWGEVTRGRRGTGLELVDHDGTLVGPFNAMLHRPAIGMGMVRAGEAIRFQNTLPDHLLELAICMVGAHWKAEFEWWAHARLARRAGVSDEILEAVRVGDEPDFGDDHESAAIHAYVRGLLDTGRPTTLVDARARTLFSEEQLVDLVSAVGYYCYISFSLNAFEIALPEGVEPAFD